MSTLLLSHRACLDHNTGAGHPERPDSPRAEAEVVALCHPMEYVEAIREAAPDNGMVHLDADTAMSPGSLEAALRAVGGGVRAVDEVMSGTAPSAPPSSISTCITATARRTSSGRTRA